MGHDWIEARRHKQLTLRQSGLIKLIRVDYRSKVLKQGTHKQPSPPGWGRLRVSKEKMERVGWWEKRSDGNEGEGNDQSQKRWQGTTTERTRIVINLQGKLSVGAERRNAVGLIDEVKDPA